MHFRARTWFILGLLCLLGAFLVWQWGGGLRRVARNGAAPDAPTQPADGANGVAVAAVAATKTPAGVNPAAAPTNGVPYRLSNTGKSFRELARSDQAILLRNALIDSSVPVALAIPAHLKAAGDPGSYIVQAKGPLTEAYRELLRQAGAEVIAYVPNNAYLVRATAEASRQLAASPQTQQVLPWEPYFKLDTELLPLAVEQLPLSDTAQLNLLLFPGQREQALQALQGLDGTVLAEDRSPFGPMLRVRSPRSSLIALAQLPSVQTIELYHRRVPLNDLARTRLLIATNSVTATPNYRDLDGAGVLVNVNDTGVWEGHPDLTGRVTGLTTDNDGHGTHVAGTIASSGANSPAGPVPGSETNANFRGVAFNASILSLPINGVGSQATDSYLQETPARTNALISNNSWSYGANGYTIGAASWDAAVRDAVPGQEGAQPLLAVFAAGNDGADGIDSPGSAKNVITVGAIKNMRYITNEVVVGDQTNQPWLGLTDTNNEVAPFSSRGNVGRQREGDSGRFKPDVVAPGTFTVSTRSTGWEPPDNRVGVIPNEILAVRLRPGESESFSDLIPDNAIQVDIVLVTNQFSGPLGVPPLSIYVGEGFAPTPPTGFLGTNRVSFDPRPGVPDFWFWTIENLNAQDVRFDIRYFITVTNDVGNEPEVLAELNSTLAPFYRYESGTSMAAAGVSGLLALMQQYYEQRLGITNSPALMKALLINGAGPVNNRLYDFNVAPAANFQGWGLPALTNSLPVAESVLADHVVSSGTMVFYDQDLSRGLVTGQSFTRIVTLSSNATTRSLRFTLVWTDPPGNPAVGVKLVNDLDLIVTNLDTKEIYVGNSFGSGDVITIGADTNAPLASDFVNNVENVYLDTAFGRPLASAYSVTVQAHRVNVNASSANTNGTVQDFALVISSGQPRSETAITVTDTPLFTQTAPLLTPVTNGVPLLNQRAGAQNPFLVMTNGITNQWRFFVVTNELPPSDPLFGNNSAATNIAFLTFLPPNLSRPRFDEADIDMYVSSDPQLTNLVPAVLDASFKSRKRTGTESVVLESEANGAVPGATFYAAVKSEDQQAANFAFFAVSSSSPFGSQDTNGNVVITGYPANVEIPDGSPEAPEAGFMFAFNTHPMVLQNVVVTNDLFHEFGGDLFGSLSHDTMNSVLNANRPFVGFVEYIYDDSDSGEIPISTPTDAPGTLRNFVGEEGLGAYILTMVDSIPHFTGQVQRLSIQLQPRKDDLTNENGIVETILPGRWFYTVVDVPADATNLAVCVSPDVGPLEVYIQRGAFPDRNTYDTFGIVAPPGDCVNLGLRDSPPLSQGRYFIGIFNPNATPVTANIKVRIERNLDLKTSVAFGSGGSTSLLDDALTNAVIRVNQDRIVADVQVGVRISHPRSADLVLHLISPKGTRILLAENRGGAFGADYGFGSLQTNVAPAAANGNAVPQTNSIGPVQSEGTVEVAYDFFNVPDRMTIYYDGQLIFDSGVVSGAGTFSVDYGPGQATNVVIVMNESGGLGGTAWNYVATIYSGYSYAIFTEDITLARLPIKFAYPPFTNYNSIVMAPVTNSVILDEGFDTTLAQCAPAYPLGTLVAGWEVYAGSVNVLAQPCGFLGLSHSGFNLLDLDGDGPGAIRRDLTTTVGKDYFLSFVYSKWPGPNPAYALVSLTGQPDMMLTADQVNSGTDLMWRTNVTRFTAVAPLTTLAFQSLSDADSTAGVFLDTFYAAEIDTKTNRGIYFLPEESLAPLRGENSFGDWKLELWDNRAGAVLTNALLAWKLNLTFVNTNPPAYALTNGVPFCTRLGSNEVVYLRIDVPITAAAATNVVAGTQPLDLVYNQLGEPALREPPDTFFLRDVPAGTAILSETGWNSFEVVTNGLVLFDGSIAPTLRPGQRYYLAVRNRSRQSNDVCVTVSFDQTTPNLVGIIPITNLCLHGVSPVTNIDSIQYYTFDVSSNALGVRFTLTGLDNDADLVVRHGLPLPTLTSFDTNSSTPGLADEFIGIDDFFHTIAGRWYIGVVNRSGDQTEYDLCAQEVGQPIPRIYPEIVYDQTIASNTVRYYQVEISSNAYLADFILTNVMGNLDFYLSTNTMSPLFATPANALYAYTGPDQPTEIQRVDGFSAVNPLTPGTWFIAVDNRDPAIADVPYSLLVHEYTTNLPYVTLTNGVAFQDEVDAGKPTGLYRFDVPSGGIQAVFELYGMNGDADLFIRYGSPLPPPGPSFLYASTNTGAADEYLCLTTNGPLVLLPGTYYIGVRPKVAGATVSYTIRATRIMSSDVTPLVNGELACGTTAVLDPNALYTGVRFFSINVPRRALQATFELFPNGEDVDLYVQRELPLTNFTAYPKGTAAYPYPGENPGGAPETVCVLPASGPVSLSEGTWFVTVVNRAATPTNYCVRASVIADTNLVRLQSGQDQFGLVGPTNGGLVAGVSYYVFRVSSNAWLGTFETFGASGNVDLFVTRDLCLPNFTTYDPTLSAYPYASLNPGRAEEFICLDTNATPVRLQPGDWYLAVVNRDLQFNTFNVRASELFATNFVPATNMISRCRTVQPGSGAAGDGVDYFVVNVETNIITALFETFNASGNVDLFVSRDPCLTNLNAFNPQFWTYPYFSVNPDTTPECISLSANNSPVPLTNGEWYVAVLNKTLVPVDYCFLYTGFTNDPYTRLVADTLTCGQMVPADNGAGGVGVTYYSFLVTTDMLQVTFDVTAPTANVDLYVSPGLCFPNRDTFSLATVNASYASTNGGVAPESICIQRNSTPVPLRPGIWYAAVVNRDNTDPAGFCIQASALLTTDVPALTNRVPFVPPGPLAAGSLHAYRYAVSPNAVQLNVEILQTTANVDLYVQRGFCPTNLASFAYASTNLSTNTEFIAIATNSSPEALRAGDWFIAVYNADGVDADYTIRVTEILASQIIRLANGIPYSNNVVAAGSPLDFPVQYYVYGVSPSARRAQFEIRQTDGDVNLYVREQLPLPTPSNAAYHSANGGQSEELVSVLDTSAPIPLTPGDWFITVTNAAALPVGYVIVATEYPSRGDNVEVTRVWLMTNSLCVTWSNTLAGVNYYVVGKPDWTSPAWLPVSETIRATGPTLTWCIGLPTPYAFFDLREGLSPLSLENPVTFTNAFVGTNGLTLCWTAPPNLLYGVYYSDSLWPLYWRPYPDYITSNTEAYKFVDDGSKTGGLNASRFYRVILLTPP